MTDLLAYIDPGSGSLIFQMLIATLMGTMFIFRRLFIIPIQFLTRVFRGTKKEKNDT